MILLQSFSQLLQVGVHRGVLFREVNWSLLRVFTADILSAISMTRQGNPNPSHLVLDCTYEWQCSHDRHRPNSTFLLALRSVWPRGTLCLRVPIAIVRTSLFETFFNMCRGTSELSLLVWMQFFPNYRITLTCHLPCRHNNTYVVWHIKTRYDWGSMKMLLRLYSDVIKEELPLLVLSLS
jgi:hypothetical protein